MTGCRFFAASLCALGLSLVILPLASGAPQSFAASPLAALDKDNDGTLDLTEVKDGARGVFVKLDNDNDTTLDRKEIQGRISRAQFKGADPDNDTTLSEDEYLALVEKLFDSADTDKDGTLDQKELHSKAGRALSRLIH